MSTKKQIRKWIAVSGLVIIFAGIISLFWYNEWVYSLPTPVPAKYIPVDKGTHINLAGKFQVADNGPVFLHFFNPDCPCSKFNIPHFKSLVEDYSGKINFAVVVMTKDKSYTEEMIRKRFGLNVPVLFDSSLATACGVYSTPQAVLMDKDHTLYYRGNYNRNRYCTDKKSNYAQMAIDSLLAFKRDPVFNPFALKAYGCPLPGCVKNQ
ncbi:MAG: redoxin domain-containing protein [Ferruginibacter sp.]